MKDDYIRRQDAVDMCGGYGCLAHLMGTIKPADVVQVVRCKDCKYWDDTEAEPLCEVLHDGDGVMYSPEPDDFCSYGERREE